VIVVSGAARKMIEEALKLPEDERAEIADELLVSLDGSGAAPYYALYTFGGARHGKDIAIGPSGDVTLSFYEDCVRIAPQYKPTLGCVASGST